MALNLLRLAEAEQVDERFEEAGVDDGCLVLRMDGHVPNACGRGEDEREVCRLNKAKERRQAVVLDNLELVFLFNDPSAKK